MVRRLAVVAVGAVAVALYAGSGVGAGIDAALSAQGRPSP